MSESEYTRSVLNDKIVNVRVMSEEDVDRLGLAKFAAVVKPVAICMACASLVVVNVRIDAFSQQVSAQNITK